MEPTRRTRRWTRTGLLALSVLVAGCATALGATAAAAPGTTTTTTTTTTMTGSAAAPGRFILAGPDATDPFILRVGGSLFLYTGQGNYPDTNIPVYEGPVPGDWGPPHDALPLLPSWVIPGFTWAPDVRRVDGGYVLFFTAMHKGVRPVEECIGAAYARDPAGPFVATDRPFVCQHQDRGSIDPRTFVDLHGQLWLCWKSDDNADPSIPWPTPGPHLTGIWVQRLSADGRRLFGPRVRIFGPSAPWEGTIVEAPDLVPAHGTYWLFFSGNWFDTPRYSVGVARCDSPTGPCREVSGAPILAADAQGEGPGESSVYDDGTHLWLLYNPWCSRVPKYTPPRPVAMAEIVFRDGRPVVVGA